MEAMRGYRVTEQIHDSEGSTVYRAAREADDQAVVLKVLKPAYPPPARIAWFRREFEIASSLHQPHVVRMLDLGTQDYRWFIAMEDNGGESLDRLLQRRRPTLSEALRIAVGLVDALGEVHAANVIHCDVNPSNVICHPETLEVRLADFGIASLFARQDAALGSGGTLQGTPAYIAPEQTGRMNRTVDYRADFYSLGVTLYEMLTGVLPFDSDDSMELVHCHLARQPIPARDRNPEVPGVLSDLVTRLMAKTAEDRYQSTFGIKADLEECLQRLEGSGTIAPFELGRHDVHERFQIPQKLYGRQAEIDSLLSAFAGAASSDDTPGAVMLVRGQSGIGKSALVHELYKPITERRGHFISGKFNQLQRTTPYSAIVAACRSLVQQILTESPEELTRWREALTEALGPGAGVVVDVIPEVELIIGPQPPVPPLGPTETENRFTRVFQAFVRVLAQPSHPVALFLDDLQWADSASLNLVHRIMQDDSHLSLLVIGAYRDDEVGPGHLLTATLDKLREEGTQIHQIHLGPLSLEHVASLIGDTTGVDPDSCEELARLVIEKTGGNPFFVSAFLTTAHHDGLIQFDRKGGHWRWDTEEIAARGYTDNVVTLTVERLRRLSHETQELLQWAASLGNDFELELLARLHESTPQETFDVLMPALTEGFVRTDSAAEVVGEDGPLLVPRYRFVHDRVQQASYELVEEAERRPIHLRIGQVLREQGGAAMSSEELFRLVGHLNLARDLITDDAEQFELATLNHEAARKAKAATAYAAAREYLLVALELIGESGWQDHRDLMLAVHHDLVDAQYLSGNHDAAEQLANEVLQRDLGDIEKAEMYFRLVTNYTLQTRYPEALEAARAGLRLVGHDVDLDDPEAALGDAAVELDDALRGRDIESLLDDPEMTDPEALVASNLFKAMAAAAFYAGPIVYSLVVFKAVNLMLTAGASPEACTLYASYGQIVSSVQGDFATGDAWGRLGVAQSERFNRRDNLAMSLFLYAGFVAPWTTHLPEVVRSLERGYSHGVESGELLFSGYTLVYVLLNKYFLGRPLEELTPELEEYLSFSEQTKSGLAVHLFTADAIIFDNLKGLHADKRIFATDSQTEEAFLEEAAEAQSLMAICYYQVCKQQVLYLYRDPRASLAASDAAHAHLANIMGNFAVSMHNLYTSLALIGCLEDASEEERESFTARIAANQEQMKIWADSCPENFLHMHRLVEAEQARASGDVATALQLYDEVAELARTHRYAVHEALAHELAGRLRAGQGLAQEARESLSAAHYGYRLWGARHKVRDLEEEFGWLADEGRERPTAASVRTTSRTTHMSKSLDLASVVKASQAISGEIVLEKLLRRLMALVIENAGAQRGVLLIDADGSLLVEAAAALATSGDAQDLDIEVRQGTPLDQYEPIPQSLVAFADRTGETVILGDALEEGGFTRDPYIVHSRPRSVLCAPLSGHGRTVGFLYLENNLVTGAFTPERMEVLQLLSAQFAISFENARLYDDMEQQVARRTEELSQKNRALEQALADLKSTQAALVHAEKMASLGQLTAGIAHEINNPLNFVNNFAELNRQLVDELIEAKDDNPDLRVADVVETLDDLKINVDTISKHGQRATGIVSSMLKHARGGTGERDVVDLNAFVGQYVNLAKFGTAADDGPIEVRLDFDEEVGQVEILPSEFGQVLVNLMNNAFDAVRDRLQGDPSSSGGAITVGTRRRDGWVEVLVSDNGNGVPEAIRDKIFEPFFTTKPGTQGTGLGLSLSYDIMVQGHGGRLAVESTPGEGSTFTVSLPATQR